MLPLRGDRERENRGQRAGGKGPGEKEQYVSDSDPSIRPYPRVLMEKALNCRARIGRHTSSERNIVFAGSADGRKPS